MQPHLLRQKREEWCMSPSRYAIATSQSPPRQAMGMSSSSPSASSKRMAASPSGLSLRAFVSPTVRPQHWTASPSAPFQSRFRVPTCAIPAQKSPTIQMKADRNISLVFMGLS